MESSIATPAGETGRVISAAQRRYILLVLTSIYVINYVDRQILSILLEPIKNELHLSDTQLGFLTGIAFAIFYATLGIPIAMLADRFNRRRIIALSLTLFSVMTMACGFVTSFWQLAIARTFVGVGEAGTSPPSHSILADLYPREQRSTALAFFSAGLNVGILIGFVVGGWVSHFYGWRVAFLVVGAPGLLIALVARLTLKPTPRGHADGHAPVGDAPSLAEVCRHIWSQPSLRHIIMGGAVSAFIGYGAVIWLPSFLIRSHGMNAGQVGTALGLIIGIAGGLGTFLSGVLADRLGRRDLRWVMWVPAIGGLVGMPFSFGLYLSTNTSLALAMLVVPSFVGAAYLGPALAMGQSLVGLRMRAATSAILLFIINIIGLGLGPQAVGLLSDVLRPSFGQDSLRYALLAGTLLSLWAVTHFFLAARTLRQDMAR